MSKRYLIVIGLSILFISCSNDINNNQSYTNTKKSKSIHIESGTNIRGMTIKTKNIQKNSNVIQNDTINTNENGIIKIGE